MGRQAVSKKDAAELNREREELIEELKYLRYFYDAIDSVVGSDDVYDIINEEYEGVVPYQYRTDLDND